MHILNDRSAAVIAAACALSPLATAASPVTGVWHGNIRYNLAKLRPELKPEQRAWLTNEAKQRMNDKLTLTLTKDHKFTLTVKGPAKPTPPVAGKWTQSGNVVEIQIVKNGQPNPPESLTLSKDGKTMTFEIPPVTYHFWR
jgi:hypothetical protein